MTPPAIDAAMLTRPMPVSASATPVGAAAPVGAFATRRVRRSITAAAPLQADTAIAVITSGFATISFLRSFSAGGRALLGPPCQSGGPDKVRPPSGLRTHRQRANARRDVGEHRGDVGAGQFHRAVRDERDQRDE